MRKKEATGWKRVQKPRPKAGTAQDPAQDPGKVSPVIPVTPITPASSEPSEPREIINYIRDLRKKDFTEAEIAGTVKQKFIGLYGSYSHNDVARAYQILDAEAARAAQDVKDNVSDFLSRQGAAEAERDDAAEVLNNAINNVNELADEMRQEREEAERIRVMYDGLTRKGERGRVLLEHGAIADYLHATLHTISFNKQVWVYDKEQGLYRENRGDVEASLRNIIDAVIFQGSITKEARDVVYILLTINRKDKYPFNQHKDAIPVKNGILQIDFTTGTINQLKHSPEWLFTVKFPVVYNPAADWRPFHEMVLSKYLEDPSEDTEPEPGKRVIDPEDLLYQVPAQCLLQMLGTKPYKKSYIIQGDANGGKTTFLEWLIMLFGPDNVSHSSLHQLVEDRFVGGTLESKVLNCYDDLSDLKLETVGPFKTLTGGFDHQIERKRVQPYQGRIFATHVFTCNSPPGVPERVIYDSAFWTRWEYLHFGNVFEVDPGFIEENYTEENISGSFNKILEVMLDIGKNGLLMDSSPSEVKDSWELSSDPFARFCKEHLMDSRDETSFPKELLHDKFREFCKAVNVNERKIPSSLKSFSTLVFKQGFKVAQRDGCWVYVCHKVWKADSPYRISAEMVKKVKDRGDNRELQLGDAS